MNLTENIREGIRSIRSNLLRTILTALIIAIGITALVGILTAVDGIQASIDNSLAELGSKSFDIRQKGFNGRGRKDGVEEKVYPPISYSEARKYKELYPYSAKISLNAFISGIAEARYGSQKTNPNSSVMGVDDNFLLAKGYNLQKGRNFSAIELDYGVKVALIGAEIAETLYKNDDPINKSIFIMGSKFKVIGILEKSGGGTMGGSGSDRRILIPLSYATQMAGSMPDFNITTIVNTSPELNYAMNEATGIMRQIRKDTPGSEDSFEISKSESMATTMQDTTGKLRIAGFVIGFITLIGAAIGLMNIMMVSVTERTREIGVRKALGATPQKIRQQFLIEAIVVCQLGGIAGVIFGIGIGNIVALLMNISVFIVPWAWILLAFIVCVVVGLISGYYPAYKASKLDPIESLRFE